MSRPWKSARMCDLVAMAAIPDMPFGSLKRPDLRRNWTNRKAPNAAVTTKLEVRARDQPGETLTKKVGPALLEFLIKAMEGFWREGATDMASMFPSDEKKTAHCLSFIAVNGMK